MKPLLWEPISQKWSFQNPTCGEELKHDILILGLANFRDFSQQPFFKAWRKKTINYQLSKLLRKLKYLKKRCLKFKCRMHNRPNVAIQKLSNVCSEFILLFDMKCQDTLIHEPLCYLKWNSCRPLAFFLLALTCNSSKRCIVVCVFAWNVICLESGSFCVQTSFECRKQNLLKAVLMRGTPIATSNYHEP